MSVAVSRQPGWMITVQRALEKFSPVPDCRSAAEKQREAIDRALERSYGTWGGQASRPFRYRQRG